MTKLVWHTVASSGNNGYVDIHRGFIPIEKYEEFRGKIEKFMAEILRDYEVVFPNIKEDMGFGSRPDPT